MKILVIDDVKRQRDAAVKQLGDHDITVVETIKEARELLKNQIFEVVLTDLMLPAENDGIGGDGENFLDQQIPYGFVIALAALQKGSRVAIVTLVNHHLHPVFWAMDSINWYEPITERLIISREVTREFIPFEEETPMEEGIIKDWKAALEKLTGGE